MSGLISIEEIGQCRSGPDNNIDLEAVFGGRISGKKQIGLKVNPLFTESSQSLSDAKEVTTDINGNMNNNVHVITYESIPTKTENMKYLIEDSSVENDLVLPHKDIITQLGDTSDVDSTVPSTGSVDSLNEKISSSYTLLSSSETGALPDGTRNKQPDNDIENNKNKRNSKTFANNYGLLHGITNGEENKISEIQLNGYHEDIKTKKKECYHLLSYNENITVINEGNEIRSTGHNDEFNNVSNNKDCISVEKSKDNSEFNMIIDNRERNPNNNTKETDIQPSTILTEAHVHTIYYNDKSESSSVKNIENETERSLVNSSTNSVLSDEDHEVIERTIEITEEWPEVNELTKTAYDQSVSKDEHDSVKITVSDQNITENDQTKITTVEIEILEEVPTSSNDTREKSNTENDPEHNESVFVETDDIVIEHISEAAEKDTAGFATTVSGEDSVTNETSHEGVTEYTEIHNSVSKAETSSTKTLKSILANNSSEPQSMTSTIKSEHQITKSDDEIQECKSVKFSEDTVFNENKSKKYRIEKVERIHLRDLYRGKISSNAAAKLNPLYKDDGELEDKEECSMTEEERAAYLEAVKKMTDSTKDKQGNLNSPTYLEHYLILKAHGLKPDDYDVEQLPRVIERPAYERLIERTLAKERRKLIIKWTLVILTVGIITAVATTLGVMLKDR